MPAGEAFVVYLHHDARPKTGHKRGGLLALQRVYPYFVQLDGPCRVGVCLAFQCGLLLGVQFLLRPFHIDMRHVYTNEEEVVAAHRLRTRGVRQILARRLIVHVGLGEGEHPLGGNAVNGL